MDRRLHREDVPQGHDRLVRTGFLLEATMTILRDEARAKSSQYTFSDHGPSANQHGFGFGEVDFNIEFREKGRQNARSP